MKYKRFRTCRLITIINTYIGFKKIHFTYCRVNKKKKRLYFPIHSLHHDRQ